MAERTRAAVNKAIGSFEEISLALEFPEKSNPQFLTHDKRLGNAVIKIQWVPTKDAAKAEASFFKINQASVQIDPTELRILKARKSPNAIGARIVVRNATGHEYWSKFEREKQEYLVTIGKEIYSMLYTPALVTPIKTLDIPVAGRGYSGQSLPLVLDLINLSNDVKVFELKGKEDTPLPSDSDGSVTARFLENMRRLIRRITGIHASSLGLHPAVYFYSASGRHQPTAVLAIFSLFHQYGGDDKKFRKFIAVRSDLEKYLIGHKDHINQIVIKQGSGAKGYERLKTYFQTIIDAFAEGCTTDEDVNDRLAEKENLQFLVEAEKKREARSGAFNGDVKSQTFLDKALEHPMRCSICGGLLHTKSIQVDHVVRKQDGGSSGPENSALAHPYCNSTVKN